MSDRWRAIREVLLRARGGEPVDDLSTDPLDDCILRGWLRTDLTITPDGVDAADYMNDDQAFERAFPAFGRKRTSPAEV